MRDLKVSVIQCELIWEEPAENRQQIQQLLATLPADSDLIILPEMFTTGFSMNALANAEPPGGPTEIWLRRIAHDRQCAVAGSIAVRVDDAVYNRLLFVTPEAGYHYDKRHLFRMGGEHKRYRFGDQRVVVPWRDWRVNLQICYDLRFPVFSRNRGDYDLILYVANWPAVRRHHWRQLLIARAIENQACVIGVNRIGRDGNGLDYSGDSLVVAADGELLLDMEQRRGTGTVTLNGDALQGYREDFPCHLDADTFDLKL